MNRDRETNFKRPINLMKSGRARVTLGGLVINKRQHETGPKLFDWSAVSIVSNGHVRVFDEMGEPVVQGRRALTHCFIHDRQSRVAGLAQRRSLRRQFRERTLLLRARAKPDRLNSWGCSAIFGLCALGAIIVWVQDPSFVWICLPIVTVAAIAITLLLRPQISGMIEIDAEGIRIEHTDGRSERASWSEFEGLRVGIRTVAIRFHNGNTVVIPSTHPRIMRTLWMIREEVLPESKAQDKRKLRGTIKRCCVYNVLGPAAIPIVFWFLPMSAMPIGWFDVWRITAFVAVMPFPALMVLLLTMMRIEKSIERHQRRFGRRR